MEAAQVEPRQHADDESQSGGRVPDLPLLVFHRYKKDMNMLSLVSSDDDDDHHILRLRLHKNVDHYAHLRKSENLYFSTQQGWILIMEYPQDKPDTSSTAAYLWNPGTGDKLPLPNIQEQHDTVLMSECRLTHKYPSHPGCVLVLLLLKAGTMHHMWFCRISGGRPWRCIPYEIPDNMGLPISKFITVVTACRGKLYFIDCSGSMGAIHFPYSNEEDDTDPVFQYFDVPRITDLPHGTTSGRRWLVDSPDNHHLFLIYECSLWNSTSKSNLLLAIHAYKMDFSTHTWHRVRDDIGDVVVFLDGGYSRMATSCAASPLGLNGSQIYLLDYRKHSDAASYCLCTFDLGLDILEDIWVPPQSLLRGTTPFWIVPPTT